MEIANNLYSWFHKESNISCIKQLSDNQILNIANDINSLFSETSLIESKPELSLPRLVVVGTQSSGKSSVLNSIISMDILPTGKNMTTKCPINIFLNKIKSQEAWIEFGFQQGSEWKIEEKINIKIPIPSQDEINQIKDTISKKTEKITGNGMNISKIPIIMKIYSPFVPNLSLIDLPGLTMVACTDKGQPENIKEQIEQLIISYIKHPKTIILVIMQSRNDLETDLGLALVKMHDLNGSRTIGVLTKPDLMNIDNNIGEYLIGNISKDLMLTFGYFVVKNRSDKDIKDGDNSKLIDLEKNYFQNHYEYSKQIYKDKTGISNLTINLSKILISSITEMIPPVFAEIVSLETKIHKKLEKLGEDIPNTKHGKINFLNKYVSNFSHKCIDCIESQGSISNIGKIIKDTFINYRINLKNIHPFLENKVYTDSYFKNIIASFEGNHMSYHTPPIQILEACMCDDKLRPILNLKDESIKCVDNICEILINLIKNIASLDEFKQYPFLATFIINTIIEELITPMKLKSKDKIIEFIKIEEDYIWTDSEEFMDFLEQINKNGKFDSENIKNFLENYYGTIKNIICHITPKIIMSNIVREIEKNLLSYLFQKVVNDDKTNLLKEDEDIEKQRKYYYDLRNKIDSIKKIFTKNTKLY